MSLWDRFLQAIPHKATRTRLFRLETILTLLYAHFVLHVLPFKSIERIMNRHPDRPEVNGTLRQRAIAGVRWIMDQTPRVLWLDIVCFPRCLAAQMMLRRRGVYTTLYYGAASFPGRGLTAHTWLQDNTPGVIDHEQACDYQVLSCYPQAQ